MRNLRAVVIAFAACGLALALPSLPSCAPGPYAGCTAGFELCWKRAEFIEADGAHMEGHEMKGACAEASNDCQRWVRLTAADRKLSAITYFPRGTARVRVDDGVSVLVP